MGLAGGKPHAGAESAAVFYDGGDEEGPYEVHSFDDAGVEQVTKIADEVLRAAGKGVVTSVTGEHEITVSVAVDGGWLRVLGPGGEGLCREVSADQGLTSWWPSTRLGPVEYHQTSLGGGGRDWFCEAQPSGDVLVYVAVDLSILDDDRPPPDQVRSAAEASVRRLLDGLSL